MLKEFLSAIFLTFLCGTSAGAATINFYWSGYVFEGDGYLSDSDKDGFITNSDITKFSAYPPSTFVLYELEDGTVVCFELSVGTISINIGAPIDVSQLTIGQSINLSGKVQVLGLDPSGIGKDEVTFWDFETIGYVGESTTLEAVPLPAAGLLLGSLLLGLPLTRRTRKG